MWLFSRKGASGFSASSTAEEVTQGIDGTGLTAVVTGASSGIGTETARVLALRAVHVVMAVKNMTAGREVKDTIAKRNPNLATNHVGKFLLTHLLLETMKKTAQGRRTEGRIVNVSSRVILITSLYNSLSAYGQSKLANVLHAKDLARRLKEDEVAITANSLHPGAIATNLFRLVGLVGKYVIKNVEQGAATTCYVALHPQITGKAGLYFADSNVAETSLQANDNALARKLWDFTFTLINNCPNNT
ncbi:hypothetical protein GOBAR_AA23809 [Gossypium barbadense]|uniref:Short-chain dehydrogenase TIC 32, chloroplastic-like n=1 Tax=Gossypium barbadense TaxID=3634 RepID=A0A2P5X0I6_GOSBA|nr:hypothetical protein GOBAR_AA23809 [Gossypium barbadense]